jgi:hypothetical protein
MGFSLFWHIGYTICVDIVMITENENIDNEFEVSFNYENVLFVCQVKLFRMENNDSYFDVDYFSPNGKGHIEHLMAASGKDGNETMTWSEEKAEHEYNFIRTLGDAIYAHEN